MNKKKIFGSIAVLAIATVAAFNINVSTQENNASTISLENVEALGQENGAKCTGPKTITCWSLNSNSCGDFTGC